LDSQDFLVFFVCLLKSTAEHAMSLDFDVLASDGQARTARLKLPHHTLQTPIFMPVGTQGSVKVRYAPQIDIARFATLVLNILTKVQGLTSQQLRDLNCDIILGNTYHLGHRPGGPLLEELGGLHKFINWDRNILTDSGGFQIVSLSKLNEISEEGVKFVSPHDSTTMMLTPEHSIGIQNQIGADIIMQLDDVVHTSVTGPRVEEAMERSLRWIDRCIAVQKNAHQNLFGIVQGGLYADLRRRSVIGLKQRNLPGYAIGGLSGGESKHDFWRMVALSTGADGGEGLPANKPRYLMGVGYPLDLVVCVALGVDMFDCVYPTRTARFGTALVPSGTMNLKKKNFASDFLPIDEKCSCMTCKNYTRAYLHSLAGKEQLGAQLISYHNIAYMMRLGREMREAIAAHRFAAFVQQFFVTQFPNKDYPLWTIEALDSVGIKLL
jgi:tRNA-guanine transglycosylase